MTLTSFTLCFPLLISMNTVHAADTPTFDSGAAEGAATGFMTPLTSTALWLVPVMTGLVLIISGLSWLTKDEDEKENKPFLKTFKRIITVAIIIECVPVLLRIFGIS